MNRDANSFMHASETGNLEMVKDLVERKRVNINDKDKYIYNVLIKAIEYRNLQVVESLIEKETILISKIMKTKPL